MHLLSRAHLARGKDPVPKDFGVEAGKDHKASDPVSVAERAAPQQQVGHIQRILASPTFAY